MKIIASLLVLFGIVTTIVVAVNDWQPIPFLTSYYAKQTGNNPGGQVYIITALLFMMPGAILMLIDKLVQKIKKKN